MHSRTSVGLLTVCAVVVGLLVGGVLRAVTSDDAETATGNSASSSPNGSPGDRQGPALQEAELERFASETATNWTANSEYVIDFVVESEAGEIDEPRGEEKVGWITRTVTLGVQDVVWTRHDPIHPLPDKPELAVPGWGFTAGDADNRQPLLFKESSWLLPGHRYVGAIAWKPAYCSPGDPRTEAEFVLLGSFGVMPYDDGILGNGEFEGTLRTAEEARAAIDPSDMNSTFRNTLIGMSAEALSDALVAEGSPERTGTSGHECKNQP